MSESALIAAMRGRRNLSATAPKSDSQTQTQAPSSSPSLPNEKLKERGQMHPSSTLVRRTDRYKEQPQSAIEVKCIFVCAFAGCPHGIIHTE